MKKIIISTIAVSALLFTVTSCKTDFDTDVKDIQVSKGSADFTRYVALGNSLTSGYRDGALYIDGQNESYPSMIAQQMKFHCTMLQGNCPKNRILIKIIT